MPVRPQPIMPKDQKELNRKVMGTPPGEELIILRDIKAHLEFSGWSQYHQAVENPRYVTLTEAKCIVFLIGGKFITGGVTVSLMGQGHWVEDESSIFLQPYTAVAIIYPEQSLIASEALALIDACH